MPEALTIEEVLDAFLAEHRQRLSSAHTMGNYEDVVDLLRHSLNGYGPGGLDRVDHQRWEKAFAAGDEEAFCHLFGPEEIPGHLPEFLGHFMVRQVLLSHELLRTAGTVTKKLATWLYEHGYVSDEERDVAVEQGAAAARDLPRAEHLANLLHDQSRVVIAHNPSAIDADGLVEDYLVIERIEPGALYSSGGIGPLPVCEQASMLAEVGWGVTITLERTENTWQIVEFGNVYPMQPPQPLSTG